MENIRSSGYINIAAFYCHRFWTLDLNFEASVTSLFIFTPRACARGKVIGRVVVVVVVVVVSRKIAISGGLGTWATSKHNESVEFGEKRAPVCFELRDMVHKRHKWCLSVSLRNHAYGQCPLNALHKGLVLSAHAHNIEYYVLVKIVNNASGTRLAGKLSTD